MTTRSRKLQGRRRCMEVISTLVLVLLFLQMITTRAQEFEFAYICNNDYFDDGDLRLECLYDLLDILSDPDQDGVVHGKKDCYGSYLYGYRWVDKTKYKAAECLDEAKGMLEGDCVHSEGGQTWDTGRETCFMRYELYPIPATPDSSQQEEYYYLNAPAPSKESSG